MEPTQNDVCPSAVFGPAGQRGGKLCFREDALCFPAFAIRAKLKICDSTGFDAELQPDARLLPVPAGQTVRPVLRHRGQSASVWTPCGHL